MLAKTQTEMMMIICNLFAADTNLISVGQTTKTAKHLVIVVSKSRCESKWQRYQNISSLALSWIYHLNSRPMGTIT